VWNRKKIFLLKKTHKATTGKQTGLFKAGTLMTNSGAMEGLVLLPGI